jgi:general secretion pathway protein D
MPGLRRLTSCVAILALFATTLPPLQARTRKGDKLLAQGRRAEVRKNWDEALDLYEQALSDDPGDAAYQLAARRVRFQAGQAHVDAGQKLRANGNLAQALLEFQKAYAIDPASSVAEQELRRTLEMIEREKRKEAEKPNAKSSPEERGLTPAEESKKHAEEKISTMLPVPELKPLNQQPINLRMNNQPPRVLFETVGKLAGINVLFDPEYTSQARPQNVEFNNSTLDEALDYLGVVTKSFWKPLSPNTIFVTNDNTTKRRDYEEQVARVFYLTNVTTAQELQEIVTAVRSVADIQRIFTYNAQNAIIVRAEADRIALAEKIISDLDKPKPEVVVDVIVMEASKVRSRDLAAAIAPNGINSPINFTPRQSITTGTTSTSNNNNNNNGQSTNTPAAASSGSTQVSIANLGRIGSRDFSLTVPGGLLEAVMKDSGSRVLQSPQVRAADGQKASLKIGDKVPYATGSFQPGIGGVGINPLVNTQFTFLDVGVNVDITPKIHGASEVSLHVELEISTVRERINLGGIEQPVVGQRKVIHDIRMREGEVNLLGGLMQEQDTKTITGVPGLSSVPVLRRLFTSESVEKNESELLIVLIPHVVRSPDITDQNLKGIAVGNATVVKLNYAAKKPAPGEQPSAVTPPAGAAAGTPAPPQTEPAAPAVVPGQPSPPPGAVAKPAPPGSLRVGFIPPQIETPVNQPVTVTLNVTDAVDLAAAPMKIKFDPKILRLNDVIRGNLLSNDGQEVIFTKNILNDTGEATINLNRKPNQGGVTGSGTLITLNFQAVGRGATTVVVPDLALRSAQNALISQSSPQVTVTVK